MITTKHLKLLVENEAPVSIDLQYQEVILRAPSLTRRGSRWSDGTSMEVIFGDEPKHRKYQRGIPTSTVRKMPRAPMERI